MNSLNKRIRWDGIFPIRIVRIFRAGRGRCEARWMDEHIIVDGETVEFAGEIHDDNMNSLTWWTDKRLCDTILAPDLTKASAAPRLCFSTITVSTGCLSRSRGFSTPTDRASVALTLSRDYPPLMLGELSRTPGQRRGGQVRWTRHGVVSFASYKSWAV